MNLTVGRGARGATRPTFANDSRAVSRSFWNRKLSMNRRIGPGTACPRIHGSALLGQAVPAPIALRFVVPKDADFGRATHTIR